MSKWKEVKCENCDGSGRIPRPRVECPRCEGRRYSKTIFGIVDCSMCGGDGYIENDVTDECILCHGTGKRVFEVEEPIEDDHFHW